VLPKNRGRMFAACKMRPRMIGNQLFTCSFRSRSNLHRIEHASELRKMISPPAIYVRDSVAIYCRPRSRALTPLPPVAVKCVDAVGHLDSRIE
jgi:hypothetical protein